MNAAQPKSIWPSLSGVILGLLLMAAGVGYIAGEPQKSAWIVALGVALLVAGGFIFRKFFKKMRAFRHTY